jgi:ribose 1,5-bisphosphokinase
MPKGTLFYIIGPSGSGKDSLITYARQAIAGERAVLFAHRYITRPMDAGGENHIELSTAEFQKRRELGLFALDWESHQNFYGVGSEIVQWLNAGATVVVNGSREYLPTAAERFPAMRVVLIDVSPNVLRQRLTDRGRETPAEIEERIDRSQQIAPVAHSNLIVLTNDDSLAGSGARFVKMLTG